jgi:DNA-binding transcriptional MerR regulator
MQKLLSTEEAAPYAGVEPKTLANWRYMGIGPRFIRTSSRRVSYDPQDIENWRAERRLTSTSQKVAA